MPTVADTLADLVRPLLGEPLPVRLRGWDGSAAGPATGPTVVLRSPKALRYLLWAPGELGLARAYVTGELDVDGDVGDGLRQVWAAVRERDLAPRLTPGVLARGAIALSRLGAVGRPLPPPAAEARPRGRLHSKRRDAAVISHHYDLSNALYTLLLDEHMAYSCAYWTDSPVGGASTYSLVDAQRDKLDLICRKLDLRPGARLLDVGCGWGALSVHAAKEYGAHVTGVTISREQLAFGQGRVAAEGLEHLVDLRLQDYRDVAISGPAEAFDAITAIEMGEHVGAGNYAVFLAKLHGLLRDEGRLLVQQMSHGSRLDKDPHPGGGPFIERYIAPDMHMRPVHETVGLIERAGFEVRDVHALREHYVRTVEAWHEEFERRWDDVVSLVGIEQARVWRLYLVGGALAFEQNRMGVDQILSVKPTADGRSGMPPTRLGWEPHVMHDVPPAPPRPRRQPPARRRSSDSE
ncbi:MAG TPA: cyclopropane-fatty-acyl-phospholipid synthase family protein [Mycobacteriales bacterium]|nr:cyclopropane-fatty-acyl-phospholipid synthase family protein [Mycobacteriales bacterium]